MLLFDQRSIGDTLLVDSSCLALEEESVVVSGGGDRGGGNVVT